MGNAPTVPRLGTLGVWFGWLCVVPSLSELGKPFSSSPASLSVFLWLETVSLV